MFWEIKSLANAAPSDLKVAAALVINYRSFATVANRFPKRYPDLFNTPRQTYFHGVSTRVRRNKNGPARPLDPRFFSFSRANRTRVLEEGRG